jgi:hypothetical protein
LFKLFLHDAEVVDEGFNYEFAAQMQEAQAMEIEIKIELAKVGFT